MNMNMDLSLDHFEKVCKFLNEQEDPGLITCAMVIYFVEMMQKSGAPENELIEKMEKLIKNMYKNRNKISLH